MQGKVRLKNTKANSYDRTLKSGEFFSIGSYAISDPLDSHVIEDQAIKSLIEKGILRVVPVEEPKKVEEKKQKSKSSVKKEVKVEGASE